MTRLFSSEQEVAAHNARVRAGRTGASEVTSEQVRPVRAYDPNRGRTKRGEMNKLESAYALEVLEARRLAGEIIGYKYEAMKLRLAKGAWWTPDFVIFNLDGTIEFAEIKGFWRQAGRQAIKVAAELHPFKFVAVQKKGGVWKYEEF